MATVSSVSPTSASWVTQLVEQTMAFERQPLQKLETRRDTLQVRSAIYNDVGTKITAARDAIEALVGTTYGLTNAFASKSVSVTNANPDVTPAKVTLNGSSAAPGTYDLVVGQLAKSHQIRTNQQAQISEALQLSGTFVIGGLAARAVAGSTGTNNPVTGFGTGASVRTGQLELGSGSYSVEFRQDSGSNWQFRIVDSSGKAVSIDDASDADSVMTSSWQDFSTVKGTTFDTGRGLTVTFANADPTQQQLFGDANIASASYSAQGASIQVSATDTLNDIRDKINKATYASGNGVQATIVDRRLVLTGASTGTAHAIKLFDSSYSGSNGNGVLYNLGIEVNNAGALTDVVNDQLRPAQNASFTINNITINRSSNTGLTDVVQGLSLDLTAEGSSTITVAKNQDKVVDNVKTMLNAVNDLVKYLKAKGQPILGDKDERGNPTYTPAPLGHDWSIRWLHQEIASDLLGKYSSAVGNSPKYLVDLGITINSQGNFELSNSQKLQDLLTSDFSGVKDLLSDVLGKLDSRLEKYVDGTGSLLSTTKSALETELKDVNDGIDRQNKLLKMREEALRTQYASIQQQLIGMTYDFQSFRSIYGSYNQSY
ncbi:MAG: hypothetical protein FOGNACKC_03674 [Anaerolineae bacterium]|nr:hypothetical protein [Anaerolineae bacterium]